MRNKKALSGVVSILVIILLAIVAFGIVSLARQSGNQDAENIELVGMCSEVEIHATNIAQAYNQNDGSELTNQYDITFSRSETGETIKGVKIIITGAEGESISEELIREIKVSEEFTETTVFENVPENFIPVKVQVVPLFMKVSGELYFCENSYTDELVFA